MLRACAWLIHWHFPFDVSFLSKPCFNVEFELPPDQYKIKQKTYSANSLFAIGNQPPKLLTNKTSIPIWCARFISIAGVSTLFFNCQPDVFACHRLYQCKCWKWCVIDNDNKHKQFVIGMLTKRVDAMPLCMQNYSQVFITIFIILKLAANKIWRQLL